ncbi:PVC-type heme-binding CxxCH protein [Verrucomicrobiota bacterium sgz303538]
MYLLRPLVVIVLAIGIIASGSASADAPPQRGEAKPLFDGQSLAGWEGDPKLWRVEDGAITGGSLTETVQRNEFLASTKEYGNFIVRFRIKLTGSDGFINSGFQIRSQRVPKSSEMSGYQCDYGDPNWWGAIYDESRRNKVLSTSDMEQLAPVIRRNDWNEYVIRADGPRITTWINGVQGTDYYENETGIPRSGKLGIQIHGGGKALVQLREITIEELPPTAPGKEFIGAAEPNKTAVTSPLSPEEERARFTLPPGFEIELVTAEEPGIGKFVTVDWDQHGRMWSMTALDYPVDGNENAAQAKALYENPGKDKVVVFDTPFAAGVQKPRVFAEGLAIPLGILPYKNGVYAQHGPNIEFLSDTNGDGKADKREVVLSGFGVQDSHLFPHQFTRAPGNWIWMAQGAFNSGKVKTTKGDEIQFDATRMAKFRHDGSEMDITSQGPCNIWGLVIGAEGETWIQEANDYGYPAMPFHEYANYPGCSDRLFKSYAPEFPGTADFRLGGTGLSGLALSDKAGAWPEAYADVMYVANPITRRINAIKIHRDGPHYRLQRLPDLVASGDEMFRPVSIQFGPDGCLYIVDWYNKIISHNEVPRNHPDRDKQRGRIWRVKCKDQTPFGVPDFTKLSGDELVAKLGGKSLRQSHLAWQAIIDRQMTELIPKLRTIVADDGRTAAQRIGAIWALEGLRGVDAGTINSMLRDGNRNVRREGVRAFGEAGLPGLVDAVAPLVDDSDPEVRAQVIRSVGSLIAHPWSNSFPRTASPDPRAIELLARFAREPLAEPTAPATRNGKPVKVREAYDREFERYLVRLFLEQQPDGAAKWLTTESARTLPVESRLLGALALKPKESAAQVAQLLPKLTRPPGQEEILRLAEFPDERGVHEALSATLENTTTRAAVLDALLSVKTRLDSAKLKPLLTESARKLFAGDNASRDLALRLAAGFQLNALEADLLDVLKSQTDAEYRLAAIRALRQLGCEQVSLFINLSKTDPDARIRDEALMTLASAKSGDAPSILLTMWKELTLPQQRAVISQLANGKNGAKAIVQAIRSRTLAMSELEGPIFDKLQTVLGNDAELAALMQEADGLFRPVLMLDGSDNAYTDAEIALDGPFTVESWVRLDPGIDNNDGVLGAPGVLDMNFYDAKFRVWVGGGMNDAIVARKPMVPNVWTHIAVTRDEQGRFKIYQDGQLDTDASKAAPQKFQHLRIGWTGPKQGTAGAMSEFRVWNRVRTQEQIASTLDRGLDVVSRPPGLIFYTAGDGQWGRLASGAKVAKTTDFPPLLTADQAAALDAKFANLRALAEKPGNIEHGKVVAGVCMGCHLIQGQGANIGPNLSGAGAMGVEALLRNILLPNAAMEAGYRIYRVEMKSGDLVEGFLVSEDKNAIVLRTPGTDDRRIARSEVQRGSFLRRSLMPEGLLDGMQPQDVSDLFAYLKTLK